MQGDELDLAGTVSGRGNLILQPLTPTQAIKIGGTDSGNANLLDLTDTELSLLQAGFSAIAIQNSSTIAIDSAGATFNTPVTIQSNSISVDGTLSGKGNATVTLQGSTTLNAGISTENQAIAINGNVTLGNPIFLDTGTGDINFNGTVNGSQNLTLNAGTGNIKIDGAVGNSIALGTLTANSSGMTRFNDIVQAASLKTDAGGETQLNGNVTTTIGQQYSDRLRIDNSITLNSLNGAIAFEDKVNSISGEVNDLTLKADIITLSGDVGNLTPLGNLTLESVNTINTEAIKAASLTATAEGNINAGNIDTSSATGTGGEMTLTSNNGAITTGDLNSSGISGGDISLNALTAITTGDIDTSGSVGDGGNVTLDPISDIEVASINSQGGSSGRGGDVKITAGQFFRATGTFSDRNGIPASISTAGGNGGGSITIRHGGNGEIPFEVGNATTNGTAGAITSGDVTLTPLRTLPFNYTEGNIQILSTDQPFNSTDITEPSQQPPAPPTTVSIPPIVIDTMTELEGNITDAFENYLGISDTPTVTLTQAQDTLSQIERATGVKPALIYALFVPTTTDSPTPANLSKSQSKPNPKQGANLWQFTSSGLSTTQESISASNQLPQMSDELELVLVTAEGQPIRRRLPGVTRQKVLNLTAQFRRAVTDVHIPQDYFTPGQQLYQWLVAPIEPELQAQQINNLVFITDSNLRSIPLAALHNGSGFILEHYSVSLMPSLSLTDTRYVPVKNLKVLAMGASQFTDQNPLPAVPFELSLIAEKLWSGQVFLNQAFTLDNLKQARAAVSFGILHLATHGEFKPGKPGNSYIQFWDTKLQLDQLRHLKLNDPPVELLVLSACRTALGDEQAELGFTGLAVQA
ncbi:MAG TPA: hypothetical protein DC064_22670, partial [Cyanobacteria bacterium UBA9273]|nr:hypothetical protein [Cyanobacteria bacterium UBA9273]